MPPPSPQSEGVAPAKETTPKVASSDKQKYSYLISPETQAVLITFAPVVAIVLLLLWMGARP